MTKKHAKSKGTALEMLTEGLCSYADKLRTALTDDISEENNDNAKLAGELAMRLTQVQAEERKARAEERKAHDEITLDEVLSFLRQRSKPEWESVKREIDARHAGKSGLA